MFRYKSTKGNILQVDYGKKLHNMYLLDQVWYVAI